MNPASEQIYLVWGQGLGVSALIATLPIAVVLYLLAVLRKPAWQAGLAGLVVASLVAVSAYAMSAKHLAAAIAYGATFGVFPLTWIIFWGLTLYRISVDTGRFDAIKSSIGAITADTRLQVLLVAFAFGAFLEGGAGFGTPVAVASAMMIGLGFSPYFASSACLLANTAPVAFGSIGIPVLTLAAITGLPFARLSADVGKICAPVSFLIPAYLIAVMCGRKAVVQVWPALLVCGGTFASLQFVVSNYIGAQLTDILSALGTLASLVLLLRFWQPAGSEHEGGPVRSGPMEGQRILSAWLPYLLLVICVLAWGYKPIQALLNHYTVSFGWPGLHNQIRRMPPVVGHSGPYAALYTMNWLSAAGTSCMAATIASVLLLRIPLRQFAQSMAIVARTLVLPTLTVSSVLALAFVMNYCGATGTLGLAFAATGVLFPFFSSLLGWVGVFLTGSDTSANALFGGLQVITAEKLGVGPVLMAASNSAGGVMGKMISLQTIAVAAAATGLPVPEQARLFRSMLKHSLLLATVIGLEVLVYAYVFRLP